MPEELSDIQLEEISFVDNPANPGAHIVLFKRSSEGHQTKEAGMADKMDPDMKDRMDKMSDAKRKKMREYMDKGMDAKKAYDEAMKMDDEDMKKSADLEAQIEDLTRENADLSKSFDELTERMVNIELAAASAGVVLKDDGTFEKAETIEIDGEMVAKSSIPAPLLKRLEATSKRLADLEKRDQEVQLAKRAQDELPNLGGTDIQKGRLLEAIDKMESKDDMLKALKAADAAVAKMFAEVGKAHDAADDSGPAVALQKMVDAYAAENGVSKEMAHTEVTRKGEGRELLKQVRAEARN